MPDQWLSVAEAAAHMKVHPRTIERRIAANKIQSHRNDDGQIQVLVDVPDIVEALPSEAFDTMKELADRQVDIAAGSASALVRIAQDQTIRAENQLLLARQDAGRYRQETKLAFNMLAVTLILVIAAVGWCTYTITAVRADARRATDNAQRAETERQQIADTARLAQAAIESERDAERQHSQASDIAAHNADLARAKAEGELAAYKTELSGVVGLTAKRPATTQPASLFERLMQASIGQ
jgi:hypothetical protein